MNTTSPQATRRLKLEFDKKCNPMFQSCTSPDSFKMQALCVKPPRTVIPVIFVPGIMGTNLRLAKAQAVDSWRPPNSTWEGLKAAKNGAAQQPAERQTLLSPTDTEVNPDGPCEVPSDLCWLTTEEARLRGWGALHAQSYHGILQQLEITLNDQYSRPGHPAERGNHLLPELGLLAHLEGGAGLPPAKGQPNYKELASKAQKAWDFAPPALSQEEILRLDDYYYPVWAHGYNWLQSNDVSAAALVKKIDHIVERYQQSDYFHCDGKVILVTHSMGGLVGRRAAQLAPDKVLGVIHGVQPVAGAPVVYRRFRAGTEVGGPFDLVGAATAAVIGWDAADTTPTMACSPGPLELLPTRHYPRGWLKVVEGSGDDAKEWISLPEADPYEEIYSKTTDECWWGMIDPALIDPAGKISTTDESSPLKSYKDALDKARGFHDTLDLYAHPETYGYYGIDEKKYPTFGQVSWQTGKLPNDDVLPLLLNRDRSRTLTGKSSVPLYEREQESPEVKLKLSNVRNQAGDGTVPLNSANVLDRLQPTPKAVFRIAGFDHQMSYENRYAVQATIYSIARLVQLAAPAKP